MLGDDPKAPSMPKMLDGAEVWALLFQNKPFLYGTGFMHYVETRCYHTGSILLSKI